MEVANQAIIATEIVIFVILGLFGNVNFIFLTYAFPQLRSKSSILQCALCFSHIICLIFEIPNAILLFTGAQLSRSTCFIIISLYIFFICAQAVIMLMLVIDIFIIVFFATFYRRVSITTYTYCILSIPFIYSAFTVTWGFLRMDDEVLLFCNPPVGMHPVVSKWWSASNVVLNTTVLVLFAILIVYFHYRGKKQKSDTRQVMRRLKVSVVVFIFSWYIAILGVDLCTALGFTGAKLAFFQSNMIFFALLCYTQSFYVILWRSSEYRLAFCKSWSWLKCFENSKTKKWMERTAKMTTVVSTVNSSKQ